MYAIWSYYEKVDDNCTVPEDIDVSFSANINDKNKTFTCSDIPNGIQGLSHEKIWVTDEQGNQDFCSYNFV